MNVSRVVIAGLYADCGKTTVATGIMSAFIKKGLKVQPFKVGPDYIDGSYHTEITKTPSRHLDAWLTSPRTVLEIFERASKNANVAVIEGAMGLFDGVTREVDGIEDYGSTAQIARILRAPVVLVLDAYGMRMHAPTVVHGFGSFDPKVKVKGVVLDNVRTREQAEWMKKTIESATNVPVIGIVPYNPEILLPTRLGGLVPIPERTTLKATLSKLTEYVGERVDIEKALNIAEKADRLPDIKNEIYPLKQKPKKVRLGVAFDEAFNFCYQDNIDLLSAYGAEVAFFSPIHAEELPPNLDGLYFPGGFPDILAEKLAVNQTMRESVKQAAEDGMPVYSEHGGSMYLTKSITNFEGSTFPMIGILPGRALMEKKLQALDYTLMETINVNLLNQKVTTTVRGHEFHFSRIVEIPDDAKFAFKMRIGKGIDGKYDGWIEHNIMAMHGQLHFAFDPKFAKNFIKHCERYKQR